MRLYNTVFMEELNEGSDLKGQNIEDESIDLGEEYNDIQDEKTKQIIKDALDSQDGESQEDDNLNEEADGKLFANKYKTVDELRKGISNIGSDLPDYILDGLSDDALEKHYLDLQKNNSKEEPKDRKYQEEEKAEEKEDEKKDVKQSIQELYSSAEKELIETGKISSELYDKLDEMGIPSNIVDKYADNVIREMQDFTTKVMDIAGGKENYDAIKSWAEENYPQSYLDNIAKMDYEGMLVAMQGIKADYESKNNINSQKRMMGNTNVNSGSGYASQDDYMKDVKNPKYGRDKAYTNSVDKKFARSKF